MRSIDDRLKSQAALQQFLKTEPNSIEIIVIIGWFISQMVNASNNEVELQRAHDKPMERDRGEKVNTVKEINLNRKKVNRVENEKFPGKKAHEWQHSYFELCTKTHAPTEKIENERRKQQRKRSEIELNLKSTKSGDIAQQSCDAFFLHKIQQKEKWRNLTSIRKIQLRSISTYDVTQSIASHFSHSLHSVRCL